MFERRIAVAEGACLTLEEMAGDVRLTGWGEPEILVQWHSGEADDLTVEETESGPVLSMRVPCEIQAPAALPVKVRQALGNLAVEGLRSAVDVEQVHGNFKIGEGKEVTVAEVYGNLKAGDLSSLRLAGTAYGEAALKSVRSVELQNIRGNLQVKSADRLRVSRVSGNLLAKEIGGPVEVDKVGGNAVLKEIAGMAILDQIAGNLVAKNLTAGAKVGRVGGNLALGGQLGAGCTYQFKADGNAALRLAEQASAHVTLRADGQLLSTVTLIDRTQEGDTLTGTLGDGGAEIVVEAGGNLVLGGSDEHAGADLGEEISRQVEDSLRAIDLEAIGRRAGEEMEAAMSRLRVKLDGMDWERIGQRAQHAVERAMAQTQRDVERLAAKASRRQEDLERRAEREAERLSRLERRWQRPVPPRPPQPAEAGVQEASGRGSAEPPEVGPDLDEERLSILRMVERGQITPEDAEMLLDALAG